MERAATVYPLALLLSSSTAEHFAKQKTKQRTLPSDDGSGGGVIEKDLKSQ